MTHLYYQFPLLPMIDTVISDLLHVTHSVKVHMQISIVVVDDFMGAMHLKCQSAYNKYISIFIKILFVLCMIYTHLPAYNFVMFNHFTNKKRELLHIHWISMVSFLKNYHKHTQALHIIPSSLLEMLRAPVMSTFASPFLKTHLSSSPSYG